MSTEKRYAVCKLTTPILVLGYVEALDIATATLIARRRWPSAGCMPWKQCTKAQRDTAERKMVRASKVAA